jgi:hypothetical protein
LGLDGMQHGARLGERQARRLAQQQCARVEAQRLASPRLVAQATSDTGARTLTAAALPASDTQPDIPAPNRPPQLAVRSACQLRATSGCEQAHACVLRAACRRARCVPVPVLPVIVFEPVHVVLDKRRAAKQSKRAYATRDTRRDPHCPRGDTHVYPHAHKARCDERYPQRPTLPPRRYPRIPTRAESEV